MKKTKKTTLITLNPDQITQLRNFRSDLLLLSASLFEFVGDAAVLRKRCQAMIEAMKIEDEIDDPQGVHLSLLAVPRGASLSEKARMTLYSRAEEVADHIIRGIEDGDYRYICPDRSHIREALHKALSSRRDSVQAIEGSSHTSSAARRVSKHRRT